MLVASFEAIKLASWTFPQTAHPTNTLIATSTTSSKLHSTVSRSRAGSSSVSRRASSECLDISTELHSPGGTQPLPLSPPLLVHCDRGTQGGGPHSIIACLQL